MRTTLTLEPDVERYIREECHRRKVSFKRVVNEALREALKPAGKEDPELLAPRSMGFAPGVDPKRLNDLAADLEVEAHLAAEGRGPYKKKGR